MRLRRVSRIFFRRGSWFFRDGQDVLRRVPTSAFAGLYILQSGQVILNDNLQAGMSVRLTDGMIAAITHVDRYYEPPTPHDPAQESPVFIPHRWTIKHVGHSVIDVSWPGYTATSSPDHLYYSVNLRSYVPANELEVGELLRTDDGMVTRTQAVSPRRLGAFELFNIEVEHYHNFFVGKPSVLVHNGNEYIRTPAEAAGEGPRYIRGNGWTDRAYAKLVQRVQAGESIEVSNLRVAAQIRRDAFPDLVRTSIEVP
jgi:hypothetical protein